MIFFFSYFWVSFMFNPIQIAEDLKHNGGFIPGVRPGTPTADFLDYTMTRLTLAGAIFLAVLAILPMAAQQLGVSAAHRPVLRRHQLAHHDRRHARHHAPDGDPPPPAPLRRLPEEGPHPRSLLRSHARARPGPGRRYRQLRLAFCGASPFSPSSEPWFRCFEELKGKGP